MINLIKEILTLGFVFPIIIIFGLFLSIKLKWIQFTQLGKALSLVMAKEKKQGISSFQAMAAVLGGNLGTGNISGVAVAMTTGGPGALFWMWVMAILASVTKYIDCFLGVHFQKQDEKGEWVGGPMYYIKNGLKKPWLAQIFCLLTIISALSVGNLAQVHALAAPFSDLNIEPIWFGIILAVLVGGVIFGGIKRFARVAEAVVPFMAIAYTLCCLAILAVFHQAIIPSIILIFKSAFALEPIAGGALGYGIIQSIGAGFDRGLFATDSGIGIAAILHGAVREEKGKIDNRVKQGLISILSPMIVMIVCTMTGLVLLSSKAYEAKGLLSTSMCMEAFRLGFNSHIAGHIVSVTLFFFAFTTILTWSFCADKAVEFLCGRKYIYYFQLIFISFIPLGSIVGETLVWTLSDISINIMFIINMIGIMILSKMVIKESKIILSKN